MVKDVPLGLLYLQQELHQEHLLTADEFIQMLELRGVRIRKDDLEEWEEAGILFPYFHMTRRLSSETGGLRYSAVFHSADYYRGRLSEGGVTFPENSAFKPWSSFVDGDEESTITLYHPLQMIWAANLDTSLNVKVAVSAIADMKGWPAKRSEEYNKILQSTLRSFKMGATKETRMQRLFVSVEDRYLPRIRRKFLLQGLPPDDMLERYYEWYDRMDVRAVVESTGLKTNDIWEMYKQLSVRGRGIDPLSDWFLLVRHMRYEKRNKLTGKALFAQDYYDRAYILKHLLEELGETNVPEPDDVMDTNEGKWKIRIYGQMVDYSSREVLRKILDEFGLDRNHRIHLFIEDESNLEATKIIATAMRLDLQAEGIHIEGLAGSSDFYNPTFVNRLMYIRGEGATPYLIVDNENKSHDQKMKLEKRGLLDKDCSRIWEGEFESDNWTDEELISQLTVMAGEEGASIEISVDDLRKYREFKILEGKPVPMVTKAIDTVLIQRGFGFLIRDRKVAFNRRLAEATARRIGAEIAGGKYAPISPIEKELQKIVGIARYGLPRDA